MQIPAPFLYQVVVRDSNKGEFIHDNNLTVNAAKAVAERLVSLGVHGVFVRKNGKTAF